jgi:ribosomal protein S18 acetylase RimI-like enzyme
MNKATPQSEEALKRPEECTAEELAEYVRLLRRGRQVKGAALERRVRSASRLAFHRDGADLVGIAALKRPLPSYKKRVFDKAGVPERAPGFDTELGWAYTAPEHRGRGICKSLVDRLLRSAPQESVFATTRAGNVPMRGILSEVGFQKVGDPFPGKVGNDLLELWLRIPPTH